MPGNKNWTAEEHAKLLVAIIQTGKPKVDTAQIAAYLNNDRTACAVYFEIRRLKLLAAGGGGRGRSTPAVKNLKRPHDHDSSQQQQPSSPDPSTSTVVKADEPRPRPVRATKPSAAKRRYDEVVGSGLWDDSTTSDEEEGRRSKRTKQGKVKFEDEFVPVVDGNVGVGVGVGGGELVETVA